VAAIGVSGPKSSIAEPCKDRGGGLSHCDRAPTQAAGESDEAQLPTQAVGLFAEATERPRGAVEETVPNG